MLHYIFLVECGRENQDIIKFQVSFIFKVVQDTASVRIMASIFKHPVSPTSLESGIRLGYRDVIIERIFMLW